ncbi:MAG: hypothetical protein Q8N08_06365 [Methanobacteriaceae archaeon]|nr:hypothetical protein [Methanobacteriaceae archaeon]
MDDARVIIFNAISLDGLITGFDVNLDFYYQLASKIDADAVLMGKEKHAKEYLK